MEKLRFLRWPTTASVLFLLAAATAHAQQQPPSPPTTLDVVTVTGKFGSARRQAFEERRALGRGRFISENEFEKHHAAVTKDLLRSFAGVNVSTPSGRSASAFEYYAVARRADAGSSKKGECYMGVFVDGHPMPTPYNLDALPLPKELMGIEIFAGPATVPAEFARLDTGCGILLVWTKDGS